MKGQRRNRHAIWSNTMQRFFKILNTLPFKGTSLPTEAALLFFPQYPPSNISKSYKTPVILGLFRNTYHYLKAHCAIGRNKIINFVLIYFTPNH